MNARLVTTGFLVLAALSLPAAAAAQTPAGRNELTVFAGMSLASPENSTTIDPTILQARALTTIFPGVVRTEVSFDGSAEFGARYGRYLSDALSISADFSIAPSHKLTQRLDFGCPDLRLCILNLPGLPPPGFTLLAPDELTTSVVAYHYGGNVNFDLLKGAIRPTVVAGLGAVSYDLGSRTETQFALRVGGGLRADTGPIVIRVEVVDVILADHFVTKQAEHDVHVRVGFGVKW
jgi:hypothetical protein